MRVTVKTRDLYSINATKLTAMTSLIILDVDSGPAFHKLFGSLDRCVYTPDKHEALTAHNSDVKRLNKTIFPYFKIYVF